MVERSRDLLDQSQGDLEHAGNDLNSDFYEWACFSAQQSAEKAVKAVFQKFGAEAWGHSSSTYYQIWRVKLTLISTSQTKSWG